MTIDKAMEIIKNEQKCVLKATAGCDRDCGRCELLRDSNDIVEAYDIALNAMFLSSLVINDGK